MVQKPNSQRTTGPDGRSPAIVNHAAGYATSVTVNSAPRQAWPRGLALLCLALAVAALYIGVAWPLRAAVELSYFDVITSDASVELVWGTEAEYNLLSFKILCKQASEPDTAYHPIGEMPARGGPELDAAYSFGITSGLNVGVPYCFRLQEVTSDGTPGDIFERCGYGLSVTPTPTPASFAITATMTAAVSITDTTVITPAAAISGTLTATPTATHTETPVPFDTPTPTAISVSPIDSSSAFDSPLPGEDGPQTGDVGGSGVNNEQVDEDLNEDLDQELPTETPIWTPTWTPTWTPEATPTETPIQEGASDGSTAANSQPTANDQPAYIVVTATPTPELTQLQFAFTPLPTTTPLPQAPLLANLLVPTTENLMVMLLCFIFFSASGFGILGLLTSALYMRSRQRRRRDFFG